MTQQVLQFLEPSQGFEAFPFNQWDHIYIYIYIVQNDLGTLFFFLGSSSKKKLGRISLLNYQLFQKFRAVWDPLILLKLKTFTESIVDKGKSYGMFGLREGERVE